MTIGVGDAFFVHHLDVLRALALGVPEQADLDHLGIVIEAPRHLALDGLTRFEPATAVHGIYSQHLQRSSTRIGRTVIGKF